MNKIVIVFLLCTASALPGQEPAPPRPPAPVVPKPISPREQRHRDYARLSRLISPIGGKGNFQMPSAGKEDAARAELHKIIAAEIAATLAQSNPTEASIKSSIQSLQGAYVLPPDNSDLPFAEVFDLNGTHTLAVAYAVVHGAGAIPEADPYLAFYQLTGSRWQERSVAPFDSQFSGASFFIYRLVPGAPGAALYLVRRKSFGQMGSRLLLRAVSFDGTQAKVLWKKDDLFAGEVNVSKDSITLAYDQEYHSPNRVHETYRTGPAGLQLTSHQVKQEN